MFSAFISDIMAESTLNSKNRFTCYLNTEVMWTDRINVQCLVWFNASYNNNHWHTFDVRLFLYEWLTVNTCFYFHFVLIFTAKHRSRNTTREYGTKNAKRYVEFAFNVIRVCLHRHLHPPPIYMRFVWLECIYICVYSFPGELNVACAKNVFLYTTQSYKRQDRENGLLGVLFITNFKLSFLPIEKDQNSIYQDNVFLQKYDITLSNIDRVYQIVDRKKRLIDAHSKISSRIEELHIICKVSRLFMVYHTSYKKIVN